MTPSPLTFDQPHPFLGKLIIVEGIDGSGKSTQLLLLKKWLEAKGLNVVFTEWNSSALVRETTRRGKKSKALTPTTFSLLHATDFASRLLVPLSPCCSTQKFTNAEHQGTSSATGPGGPWTVDCRNRSMSGFDLRPAISRSPSSWKAVFNQGGSSGCTLSGFAILDTPLGRPQDAQ